jgi:hypothetical protein
MVDHSARPSLADAPQWRSAALVASAIAAVELVLLIAAAVVLFTEPFADEVERKEQAAVAAVEAQPPPAPPTPAPSGAAASKEPATKQVATPATSQTAAKSPSDSAKKPQQILARPDTSVLVLNGNGRTGAAGEAAGSVQGLGYIISGTANAPRTDYPRSIVMFRPGFKPEAQRLARDVRVTRVTPLDGLDSTDLSGAHVVLIVGN